MKIKENEFREILENKDKNENHVQKFLEENTEFIPLMFLLNHQLHFNVIVSKFKLSESYTVDFMYLTKSSDEWHCVFIEIENQHKKIFNKNKENIHFSWDFNHAFDQISSWRSYIDKNRESVLKKIEILKKPLEKNRVNFKYILVLWRNDEKKLEKQQEIFTNRTNNDTRIITYDTIINSVNYNKSNNRHILLSEWKSWYKIKELDSLNTSIFAYINSSYLKLTDKQKEVLMKDWYEINEWEKWNFLNYNQKKYIDFSKKKSIWIKINQEIAKKNF